MAFENLSERLQKAIRMFRNGGKITEDDLKAPLREVRMALLEADVNFKVVKDFVATIRERAVGVIVNEGLTPGQQIIKIVNEELTKLLGGTQSKLAVSPKPPTVIMLVGLQGAGKTTTAGKLANMLRKKGKHPMLVAADVYRPAAIKQLEVLGAQLNIPVFTLGDKVSPVEIAKEAMAKAHSMNYDTVIIDTAGRLHIDEDMMAELQEIKEKFSIPTQVCYLVHVSTMLEAIRMGAPTDLVFASISGTQKCNDTFGISARILDEAAETVRRSGTSVGPNVLYFETGQGPENAGNMHNGADMVTLEARTYGFGRHFSPFIMNDVTGFVGPEVQANYKQCIRSTLEDNFMAKMLGCPFGTDIAFSSHVKADYDDNDIVLMAGTLAGTNFWMGISGGADATDYNMESSFQDLATLREMCGLRVVPAFEKWCQKMGIMDECGRLTDLAGDPSIFL